MNQERAFTVTGSAVANQLISFVGVSQAHGPQDGASMPVPIRFKGIWDTGATGSVITKRLAEKLDLKPIGKTLVQGVTGSDTHNRFLVNFYLPNNVAIPYVSVTECEWLAGNFDVLIGMDIICLGDFAVSNFNQKTIFTFRTPSMEAIDFVKDIQARRVKRVSDDKRYYGEKVGRNDPCPCGSNKKFKKCHGS